MQSSPVSALPFVAPGKAQVMDSISASGIPAAETTLEVTFESLLAQQAQVQPALQSDELALSAGPQRAPKDRVDTDDLSFREDPSLVATDLAALLATLVQAAVPMRPAEQAAAPTTDGGVDDAITDAIDPGARREALSFLPGNSLPVVSAAVAAVNAKLGKEAAEIAGIGKDLPVVGGKVSVEIKPDHEAKAGADIKLAQEAKAGADIKFNQEAKAGAEAKVNQEFKLNQEAKVNAVTFQFDKQDGVQDVVRIETPRSEAFSPITGVQVNNEKSAVTVSVEPRVGVPGWDGALGQKVVWLVNQRHQSAEMQLNPPNLGPLEVRITITHDQANAHFVSHHVAVRDAIEAALPRLREMLAENGITLGNAQVSSESFPRGQPNGEQRAESGWKPDVHDIKISDGAGERAGVARLRIPGSVDIFA